MGDGESGFGLGLGFVVDGFDEGAHEMGDGRWEMGRDRWGLNKWGL